MTQKTWVVTFQSLDGNGALSEPQLVEHISARKKIGFIDDYLCDLYEDMLDEHEAAIQDNENPVVFDDALIRSKIIHPSGTEVILDYAPFSLKATLQTIEQE